MIYTVSVGDWSQSGDVGGAFAGFPIYIGPRADVEQPVSINL